MKNKLSDLNDHLFTQLERLSDEDLSGPALEREVQRSQAIAQMADRIVENARIQLAAVKLITENNNALGRLPSTMALGAGAPPA